MVSIEDVLQVIAKHQKVLQSIKIILLDIAGYRKTSDGVDISKENSQGVTGYHMLSPYYILCYLRITIFKVNVE